MTNDIAPLRWGVIGPGSIAQRFAGALRSVPGARIVAVAARDAQRAGMFVRDWCGGVGTRIVATPAELAAAPEVDAVYVATTHDAHWAGVRACLLGGKPVLCEKPLTPTAAQAFELITLARERKVFLMEALWTRFLPAWQQVRQWLADDAIGRVHTIQSSICLASPHPPEHRHFNPALAGGALLDLGVYSLSLSQWVMALQGRHEPPRIHATGRRGATGVDVRVHATLDYRDDTVAQFVCALDGEAENGLRIHGERGCIEVSAGFWYAQAATLRRAGREPEHVPRPFRVNGFEYEIEETARCIAEGRTESAVMPLEHTLLALRMIDAIRLQVGVRYPFE